jgi:hypothetical protein
MADLRPPERPVLTCAGCSREFHEDRALKQHAMSCRALKEQLDKEAEAS